MNNLELSTKYEPLFKWFTGCFPDVDTVIITGGRNSQKSFAVGVFACVAAKDFNHRILYTRYTLTSAEDSIIPEFNEKIDILGAYNDFDVTRDRIVGRSNESKIVFKGIKTSSGNQTASLKSLKNFSMFILEEAEEMPNFDDWDKVKKSIRVTDVQNLNILLLNPTTKTHWIYEEFFEGRGVEEGFNGVVGNIMYIHSCYLDMERKFIPDNHWNDFEEKRVAYQEWIKLPKEDRDNSPLRKAAKYYKHTVMGGWLEKSEGVIFDNWTTGNFIDTGYTMYGCDFGFSDPTTLIKVSIDESAKKMYMHEDYYKSNVTETDIYNAIVSTCGSNAIIADSAMPMIIESMKRKGINMEACVKGADSIKAGITLMQDYDIIVSPTSTNLIKELNNYSWNNKKSGVPIDAYNHCIDAGRYAASALAKPKRSAWAVGW